MGSGTVARNDPCPCGSGEKYKKCCLRTGGFEKKRREQQALWVGLGVLVAALVVGYQWGTPPALAVGGIGALVVGAMLYFSDPPNPRGGGDPGAIGFGR